MIVVDGVLFEFVDVTLRRGEHAVLDSVDATLSDHGITVIVGPSGAGKSTLLRLCNRLDIPTSGTVRFRGADVITLDPRDLRRRVGMVFQRPVVLPGTVAANVGEGDPDATAAQIEHALDQVGLSGTGVKEQSTLGRAQGRKFLVQCRGHHVRPGADQGGACAQAAGGYCVERLLAEHPRKWLLRRGTVHQPRARPIGQLGCRVREEDLRGSASGHAAHDVGHPQRRRFAARLDRPAVGLACHQPGPGRPDAGTRSACQRQQ